MIFHVTLNNAYIVRVSRSPIYNDEGEELWAFADPVRDEIVISPRCPLNKRSNRLRHEFWHVWCYHHPEPTSQEDQAVMFATVSEEFDKQFTAQGGQKALLALKPQRRGHIRRSMPGSKTEVPFYRPPPPVFPRKHGARDASGTRRRMAKKH